jgi:hypothetical protein
MAMNQSGLGAIADFGRRGLILPFGLKINSSKVNF